MEELCNKVPFTKLEARLCLIESRKTNAPWRKECRIYFCKKHRAWHLTSKTKGLGALKEIEDLEYTEKWKNIISKCSNI